MKCLKEENCTTIFIIYLKETYFHKLEIMPAVACCRNDGITTTNLDAGKEMSNPLRLLAHL